jgi:hypothetical protein
MARDKEGMDMARHTRWTNADLIKGMLCVKYYGYKVLDTFQTVLYNGQFYSLSLIQKDEDRKAILSQRKCDGYSWFFEVEKEISFSSKEEGNNFYKALVATENVSKSNNVYYKLKREMIR